ncbi:MAG: GerAB/ArcD/ProY family transporter [Sporolactobacillus sp.]
MTDKINKAHQLSPLSAFFIPQSLQLGANLLLLPRPLVDYSFQDAWIGILISGFVSLAIMWLILRLLENEHVYGRADLFSIHRRLFGKWAGNILNFIFLGMVMLDLVRLLRYYTEIYQVWLFPNLSVFIFSSIICLIVGYIVLGGIRNIGGIALLSFIYLIPLFQTLNFTVPYLRFSNLLPMFDHTPLDILKSCYFGATAYLNFELIVFFYPFIGQPEKARKWAFFGMVTTIIIYLNLTVVGIMFSTQGAIQNSIWPFMSLLKTLQIPFFNHAEKLATVFFVWSLVPNICLSVWIVIRGIKFTFPIVNQKYLIVTVLALSVGLSLLITNGDQIRGANQLYGIIGVIFTYGYLPFLLICQWLNKKIRESV